MRKQVLVINPKGEGDLHELRAQRLSAFLDADITFYNVDRKVSYPKSMSGVWQVIASKHWSLIYQESSGIIGGLNLIRAAKTLKLKYIVSSGDPIAGFFSATKGAAIGRVFEIYERSLYKNSAGFVGWTPYLTGAALKMGAPRAVTIEGAVQTDAFRRLPDPERAAARKRFGLKAGDTVCGMVGSLKWNSRAQYCYGLELVEMLKRVTRSDVSVLIVGDGSGRSVLESRIPDALKGRIIFTGRLPEADVITAINAMDIGFITQTLDQLGSFRLTTKLPEYLACGLPVAMSPIPGFYDYVADAGWALPQARHHPADPAFHDRCAKWIDSLSNADIQAKASKTVAIAKSRFEYDIVGPRFREFVDSITD
jgi:hypothetical protein